MFEAAVSNKVTHTFVYVCVLLGNRFVADATVSEDLHCLEEDLFLLISLHLFAVLFCEILLRVTVL